MNKSLIVLLCINLTACNFNLSEITWEEVGYNNVSDIKPGIPAYNDTKIDYHQNDKSVFKVSLEDPVVVCVASKPEEWGFFQFPDIHRTKEGLLVASWNMAEDAVESYGIEKFGIAVSEDGGKTWNSPEGESHSDSGLDLPNGDRIQIYTPKAIKVDELQLPDSVGYSIENYGRFFTYYKMTELPELLQGVYLKRMIKGSNLWTIEHAVIDDPLAVRYTDSGLFPVVWCCDMHLASDESIISGIYPGFYLDVNNEVAPSGIIFYRSTDNGHTWNVHGRIPYEPDLLSDQNGDKRIAFGFTEPAFIILSNDTYLCVMRTTDGLGNSPMYMSLSINSGITWSKPIPFTRNGVMPRLLQLKNGVIVLASGRPGVQLRFSFDGKVEKWTDPFEMLPFKNDKEDVSCGYTELLETGPDRFLLVYSDFNYINEEGEIRKAIKIREIKVSSE